MDHFSMLVIALHFTLFFNTDHYLYNYTSKRINEKNMFTVSLSYRFQEVKDNSVAEFTVRGLCRRQKVRTCEKMQTLETNQICTTKQNKINDKFWEFDDNI